MKITLAMGLVGMLAGDARANAIDAWQVGVQVSSDSDTQQARVDGGVHLGAWKLGLVVDAQPFADGSDDLDATVEFHPSSDAWGLLGGWRTCSISIEQGRQWHQQLLLGATGALPRVFDGRLQPSFGGALAVTMVRHGDGLESDWLSLESARHVKDTVSLTLFLRFDYVSAL